MFEAQPDPFAISAPPLVSLRGLVKNYGQVQALRGLDLTIPAGQVFGFLGRNGAGKSTTLKTVSGWLHPSHGSIHLDRRRIDGDPSYRIARAGLGFVPEGRRIFTDLTVAQNLEVGRRDAHAAAPWTAQRVFALFPALAELQGRRGGQLSGGEQQMLAIARTLMGNPRLLLLDEPGEGLAPLIVRQLGDALRELKHSGVSILLAEQSLALAARIADRAYILQTGRVLMQGAAADIKRNPDVRKAYLGL